MYDLQKKHLSFHLNFVVNYFIDGRFTSVKYAFDNAVIKWKTKQYHTVRTVPKFNRKS
jgi:hypothetical protein